MDIIFYNQVILVWFRVPSPNLGFNLVLGLNKCWADREVPEIYIWHWAGDSAGSFEF